MTAYRDQVMDALLALLQARCGATFVTYSRRFVTWEDLIQRSKSSAVVPQPALFLMDGAGLGGGRNTYQPRGRASPGINIIERTICIYAQMTGAATPGGPDASSFTDAGGTIFYPLEEAVINALAQPDSVSENTLTLGGLVSHCWLEGDGIIITGEIDPAGQGMMTMPVRIMFYPFSQ